MIKEIYSNLDYVQNSKRIRKPQLIYLYKTNISTGSNVAGSEEYGQKVKGDKFYEDKRAKKNAWYKVEEEVRMEEGKII